MCIVEEHLNCKLCCLKIEHSLIYEVVPQNVHEYEHRDKDMCCLKIEHSLIYEVVPQNVHEYEHRDKDKLNTGH